MNSYLLLSKPAGITSFEALRPVKRALGTGKVGHTGTLDKFAEGLLVVLAGGALKLSSFITGHDKRYEATIHFGSETDTLDPEGAVIDRAPPPSPAALDAALDKFRGTLTQRPPVYSAIHIDGKRASEIARAGGNAEPPPRSVTIYRLELNDYTPPDAKITVHCSAGTYIRSLARDIARAADSRAHLAALTRTQVGNFCLCDAVEIAAHGGFGVNTARDAAERDAIRAALRPAGRSFFAALDIPCADVDAAAAAALRQGRNLDAVFRGAALPHSEYAALFHQDRLAALIERRGGRWAYRFVVPADAEGV